MAKAKILADRISITSEVLTDENIERVRVLSPRTLVVFDTVDADNALYEVTIGECNTFSPYGAVFKDGKSIGAIDKSVMELPTEEREVKLKNYLTAVLTKITVIENQVSEYLDNAEDLNEDIEFLD